jgi:hypothetical protein
MDGTFTGSMLEPKFNKGKNETIALSTTEVHDLNHLSEQVEQGNECSGSRKGHQ